MIAKSGSNAVLLAIFLFRSCANAALKILVPHPVLARQPHSQKTASSTAIVISTGSAGSRCDAAEKPNRMIHVHPFAWSMF